VPHTGSVPHVTRRSVILGAASAVMLAGAAALAVDEGILPGRATLFRSLDLDGAAGVVPKSKPGALISGSFRSAARLGKSCGWSISYPPGTTPGDALPLLVVLHGYNGSHTGAFGNHLGLDHFLAASVNQGARPFAIASVDGGNTYYHRRVSGEDAAAMVTDEFLPLLARSGLRTNRVALMGWSMGGYGALHIAGRLGGDRVVAVVAESPALWRHAAQTPPPAFDNPEDFAANTVFGRQSQLAGIPVRVDCGRGDGFYPAAKAYVAGFPKLPAGGFSAGGHNLDYWRRMAPAQLEFVGKYLS
jgi:pimeloyl-ACP methyl ester carboxylesterase